MCVCPYSDNDWLCKNQEIGTSTERGKSKECWESMSIEGVLASCNFWCHMQEWY